MKKKAAAVLIGLIILAIIITFGRVFTINSIEERFEEAPLFVEQGQITQLSGIRLDGNIFAVNKTKAIKNVADSYKDNSVVILGIERKFPNKIVIYCKERLPIMRLSIKNSDNYAIADIDFQLNKIIGKDEAMGLDFISVEGIEIDDSFNLYKLTRLRSLLYTFVETGTPIHLLPRIIKTIQITDFGFRVIYVDDVKQDFVD